MKFGARPDESANQFPVHRETEGFIDASAHFLPDTGSPKHRFLGDVVRIGQDEFPVTRQNPFSNVEAIFIDQNPVSVDDIVIFIGQERPGHPER